MLDPLSFWIDFAIHPPVYVNIMEIVCIFFIAMFKSANFDTRNSKLTL